MAEKVTAFDYKSGSFEWGVPFQGIQNGLPVQQIPADALYDARNVILTDQFLTARPGMTQFASTVLTGRPTGFYTSNSLAAGAFQQDTFQNDVFQVASGLPGTYVVVSTTRKTYVFHGNAFNDITGTTYTAAENNLARHTGIQIGTPPVLYLIHCNGLDPIRQWDSVGASMTTVAGSPPVFSDVTTIDNRIVGVVQPYDVRWSPVLDITSWPSTNIRVLADTPDRIIGISNFGLNGGVVYKSQSIWNIVVTGSGAESTAFRLDFKKQIEGPASPAAIVNAGVHFYMTALGRIATYDLFNHRWIADGVWPIIKAHIDPDYTDRIVGAYDPKLDIVSFFYARIGDGGENKGRVDIMLPSASRNISDYICFLSTMTQGISAAGDSRLDTKKMYLGSSTDSKVYTAEGANDAGVNFTGYFQTGLPKVPKAQPGRVGSIEVFAERGAGYGTLTFKPVTSNILDTPGGNVANDGVDIDLTDSSKVFDLKGMFDGARGRFIGSRFEFTTPVTLRYKGALMTLVDRDV